MMRCSTEGLQAASEGALNFKLTLISNRTLDQTLMGMRRSSRLLGGNCGRSVCALFRNSNQDMEQVLRVKYDSTLLDCTVLCCIAVVVVLGYANCEI